MSETSQRRCDRQEIAHRSGLHLLSLESEWWGNEKFGTWTPHVWALIDTQTDDAYHIAAATPNASALTPRFTLRRDRMTTDTWMPTSKSLLEVEPQMVEYRRREPTGMIHIAGHQRTRYGDKVCLWGDTYDALSSDGDELLADAWDAYHATFDDTFGCWTVDKIDRVLIDHLVDAGYHLKVAGELKPGG